MQQKRERIRFQQKKGRPPLSRDEAEYWLEFLPKVLKIGTEFEVNLPSVGRSLAKREQLPCVYEPRGCARDCANLETCLVDRHPALCLTRSSRKLLEKTFKCPAKDGADLKACESCEGWILRCEKTDCSMYVPFCAVCPTFRREGEVVENEDIRRDAETVRQEMRALLKPTEFVGQMGETGVLEVKKDNSLANNGGIEIPTVGRRIHWNSFYQMCQSILEPLAARGGFVNERCGQHYHLLAGYFSGPRIGNAISELERPMPEVIVANLHQLYRRYELALFWLTSAGTKKEHLTRWSRFRQSLHRFSALRSRMQKIQAEIGEVVVGMNSASAMKGKYAAVAYHFCKFNGDGDLTTFHIENRIPDGCMSSAVVAAWAMLVFALTLKAVRLSQYGIMETGSQEYMTKIKEIQPHLIDGEMREWGEYRHADTSNLGPHILWLRQNALELVNWLKPELTGLGPSYEILLSLAERPCSVRLCEGQTWEQIEEELYGAYQPRSVESIYLSEGEVREIVDLASIVDCGHLEMWIEEVAAYLGQQPPIVADVVHQMLETGKYRWSDPIGALINA